MDPRVATLGDLSYVDTGVSRV
ncbi:protein of unknown function (plasmid) [Cupriavidus neocaledonicus]|uniref:Uncharacterized protein n=1 Tax=Cupriavidus neocaledonicus TaxID=1040979 RepID=A0A375HQM0_9BURK|nr:hypothetical protein CBM2605_B130334 [Cupriavidus neocaledonicus]SPD59296.1 protein of unknown function [Cupriavidus neocaledonicus]